MVRNESGFESDGEVSRRTLLRGVGSVGAAGALGLGAVAPAAASRCCPCFDGEEKNYSEIDYDARVADEDNKRDQPSGNPYEYAMDNRHTALLGSSEKIDGRWTHTFYVGSYFRSARRPGGSTDSDDWELYPNVSSHGMDIYNIRDDTSSLYTTRNDYDVGAAPSPNGSSNDGYGDAAFTAFSLVLGRTNPQLATALTAAQLTVQLLDNDEDSQESNHVSYSWYYGTDRERCEAINYCHFLIRNHDGHHQAEVEVDMYGSSGIASVGGDLYFDLYVDPYSGSDFTSTDYGSSSFSEMSDEEQRQFMEESPDFRKIPYDEIEDEHKRELANGKPIWRALDPEVVVDSRTRSS